MIGIAERVRVSRLPNGVEAYLLENHTNSTVDVVGYIDGGMFLEDPGLSGVAQLCTSMLDRGTKHRDHGAIADALESNGARLGYGLRAEVVTFRARCLSEDLAMLIEILGDTLAFPAFPEDQLRLVIEDAKAGLREIAYDTYTRAYRRGTSLLLGPAHPYAREPLGREDVLEVLSSTDLHAYHERAVAAGSRMRLAVVGDIDVAATETLLVNNLGAIPRGDVNVDYRAGELARETRGRDHVAVRDKEQIDVVFLLPGIARTSDRFTAGSLANFLLGGSFVSRLNQQLRDQEGLTYGAQSVITSGLHSGLWSAYVGVHPQNLERAVEGTRREVRRLASEGAGEEELQLAREHLTGSFPIRLETNRVVGAVLLEGIRSGKGLDFIDRYTERVRSVTLDDVNAAARELWLSGEPVVVTAGTGGA